jgi:hypothetical protein
MQIDILPPRPIEFFYSINGTALERVNEIKDLGVIMDERPHIEANRRECWVFLGVFQESFMTRIYPKTLYTSLVRPNLEHATCVWSPHQSVHSERLEQVQHNFIHYAVRWLPWRVWPLPPYDARCLLIGLEIFSVRRIVASALFATGHSSWQGRFREPCSHAAFGGDLLL